MHTFAQIPEIKADFAEEEGNWLLASGRSFNGKGAVGILRRCELIRFWHEWRWPVRENLLSWLRWCPFLVTFLGTQKSNKTCISAQIIRVKHRRNN